MNSVLQTKKECFFCKTTRNLHRHHVLYGSSNRKQAEKYGFTVYGRKGGRGLPASK